MATTPGPNFTNPVQNALDKVTLTSPIIDRLQCVIWDWRSFTYQVPLQVWRSLFQEDSTFLPAPERDIAWFSMQLGYLIYCLQVTWLYYCEWKAMKIECINEIGDHIQLHVQVCNKQDNILVTHTVHVYIKFNNNPDSFSQPSWTSVKSAQPGYYIVNIPSVLGPYWSCPDHPG